MKAFKVVVDGKGGFKAYSLSPFSLRNVIRKERKIGGNAKVERCEIWGAFMPEQMENGRVVFKSLDTVF